MSNLLWGILRVLLCLFWGLVCYNAGKEQGKKELNSYITKVSTLFLTSAKDMANKYAELISKDKKSLEKLKEYLESKGEK